MGTTETGDNQHISTIQEMGKWEPDNKGKPEISGEICGGFLRTHSTDDNGKPDDEMAPGAGQGKGGTRRRIG
jgi:hypothetical protein